ncbi:hypothetical protein [Methylobacterium radiotolerans]|uniref:hypothetical protein n=1 Tax=Methylobacterium radiotolerans TaxID=31998 RepID=UPI000B76F1FB|nr:hypothetical protein [Methylobacterium radiotolerans]OXE37793.1 hypothetical protein CCS92_34455 [Methylobacterium radiotolerans]
MSDSLVRRRAARKPRPATLPPEPKCSGRGLPTVGNLTHAGQQRRYPGDNGLFDIPQMINRRRPWNPEIPESET